MRAPALLRAWRNRQPQKAHDTAECGKAGAQGERERSPVAAGKAEAERRHAAPRVCPIKRAVATMPLAEPAAMGGRARHDRPHVRGLEEAKAEAAELIRQTMSGDAGLAGSIASSAMPRASRTNPRLPSTPAEIPADSRPPIGAMMATTSGQGVMRKPVST